MAHDSFWEETLLADMEVRIIWIGRRDWKPGAALHGWNADPVSMGIYLVESGVLEVTLDGERWRIKSGEAFFVPAGRVRECIATTQGARWFSLGLGVTLYGQVNLTPMFEKSLCWVPSPLLSAWLRTISDMWHKEEFVLNNPLVANLQPPDPVARFVADALGKAIFGLCWREVLRPSVTTLHLPEAPAWLWEVLEQMYQEPHRSLVEFGKAVSVSPAHLRRTFHRYLRQSPLAYLTERRLQRARQLLERTERTVLSIAVEVGFDSLSHFTRLFTQRFGTPPARHRRHLQNANL